MWTVYHDDVLSFSYLYIPNGQLKTHTHTHNTFFNLPFHSTYSYHKTKYLDTESIKPHVILPLSLSVSLKSDKILCLNVLI